MAEAAKRVHHVVGDPPFAARAVSGTARPTAPVPQAHTNRPHARVRGGPVARRVIRRRTAEGGELVIYAGGDTANQQDATKQAFLSQFPDIKLTMVVDYSKHHDVRVDNRLATGTLVPDVVQLQTLQDTASRN
jgi:hypothetical protein